RQHLLLARAAFTLEEAAGNLAGREGLFLVVDRQREEIDAGVRRPRAYDGAEDHGVAVTAQHGAVGLAGDAAGLPGQLAVAPLDFLAVDLEHRNFILSGIGRS